MCICEESVFFCIWMDVLKISMRYISSNASLQTCISLLIFYFDDLSIGVSGVFMAESEEELKSLLMKVKEESEKIWLKTQHSENEDHGMSFHHFMSNRWGTMETVRDFIWGGLQDHYRW